MAACVEVPLGVDDCGEVGSERDLGYLVGLKGGGVGRCEEGGREHGVSVAVAELPGIVRAEGAARLVGEDDSRSCWPALYALHCHGFVIFGKEAHGGQWKRMASVK